MPLLEPTGLPVEAVVGELVEALGERGAAVLVAEPGAGKTTVVPLRLAEAGWLEGRKVLLLEPRRVAARAAASRMAAMLGERVGGRVGLRTRDETRVSASTRVEVVTEGVLTRMLQRDPGLEGVGVVVFDEFHERSLHADLGLALASEVRRELRPDLALLVASATIDAERVAGVLASSGVGESAVPVVVAPGRLHPVELRWQPVPSVHRNRFGGLGVPDATVVDAVLVALDGVDGDVLVFLEGAGAIRRVVRALQSRLADRPVDVLPLFGALPAAEQDRALARSAVGRRRVVVATDLAETSLTVEGVAAVVDSGLSRVPRFDPRSGMTRLVTVPISQASADQRAGRAGREGPGLAVRLWSAAEHATRRPHTPPAILQEDLTGLVLELAVWGSAQSEMAFLDPPPPAATGAARRILAQLGALDDGGRATARGRALADLPIHPRLARMLLAGSESGDLRTACLLAALLDERDVLSGRPDEVPTDLALRLRLLDGQVGGHPLADAGSLARVRRRAEDLQRRMGRAAKTRSSPSSGSGGASGMGGASGSDVAPGTGGASVTGGVRSKRSAGTVEGRRSVDLSAVGPLVATAYPDRVARARTGGASGRFRLASGGGAWMAPHDELADEDLVVAADLDGDRRDARIRLAAALDEVALVAMSPVGPAERRRTVWDRDRDEPVVEVVRHLDGVELSVRTEPARPGPATTAALVDHVAGAGLDVLGWTRSSRGLLARLGFLHAHRPDEWPPVSEEHLLATVEEWLAPMIPSATRRADLSRVDPAAVLVAGLDHGRRRDLDRLAPTKLVLASGREVPVDYGSGEPVVAIAPQQLFGTTSHPSVLDGEVPVVFHLLSPAGRPVQITADLPGFWSGSWAEVRKEMAGRYPKHPWPTDPATATPPTPRRRP